MTDTPANPPSKTPRGRTVPILAVTLSAVISLVLDLWSKAWVWNGIRKTGKSVEVIADFLYLDFSFNTGAAFGFLNSSAYARPMFIAITLATVAYMINWVRKLPTDRLYGFLAIGMIIGGALGNLHDRFFRMIYEKHGVVDFILVYYLPGKAWPTFNIADAALVIGVGLLIPYLILHAEPPEAKPAETQPEAQPAKS